MNFINPAWGLQDDGTTSEADGDADADSQPVIDQPAAEFARKVGLVTQAFLNRPGGLAAIGGTGAGAIADLSGPEQRLAKALMQSRRQGPLPPPGPDSQARYPWNLPNNNFNFALRGRSPESFLTPLSNSLFSSAKSGTNNGFGTGTDSAGGPQGPAPDSPKVQPSAIDVDALTARSKRGDRGEKVANLQRALGITADGVYGPDTQAAVNGYRAASGASGTLGLASELLESGGQGAKSVSPGTNDPGGVSYGARQIASATGTMAAFLKSDEAKPFAAEFAGLTPGTPEFRAAYDRVVQGDENGFAKAQQDFLERTHYKPVLTKATQLGFDVGDPGIREALYSQSIQHKEEGNDKILRNVIANYPGITQQPADQQIDAIYAERGKYASQFVGPEASTTRYAREAPLMKQVSKYYQSYFQGK